MDNQCNINNYPNYCSSKNKLKLKEDDADDDDKTVRHNLARLYFTNEAARLVACSSLGTTQEPTFGKCESIVKKRPTIPPFLTKRLAAEARNTKRLRECAKIQSLKNELDTFDKQILNAKADKGGAGDSFVDFDPKADHPTAKSLRAMKQKMERIRLQRKREAKATTVRFRGRKLFFPKLVSRVDNVEKDLIEYTNSLVPRKSHAETKFMSEIDEVINHKLFQEFKSRFDREKFASNKEASKAVKEILDVILETVIKVSWHRCAKEKDPPKELETEWRNELFMEIDVKENNENCPEVLELAERRNKIGKDILDVLVDVAVQSSEYKDEHGFEPSKLLWFKWRSDQLVTKYGYECSWKDELDATPEQFLEDVLKLSQDLVLKKCEYRAANERDLPESIYQEWWSDAFEFLIDPDCMMKQTVAKIGEVLAEDIFKVVLDVAFKLRQFEEKGDENVTDTLRKQWQDAGFNFEGDCLRKNSDSNIELVVADLIDVGILDEVVKTAEFKSDYGEDPTENLWQEWRDEGFERLTDKKCLAKVGEGITNHQLIRNILEVEVDVAVKSSEYKSEKGDLPSNDTVQKWRDSALEIIAESQCLKKDVKDANEQIAHGILDTLLDVVIKASHYKDVKGEYPPQNLTSKWMEETFSEFDFDSDCTKKLDGANTDWQLLKCVFKIVKDVVMKVNKYRTIVGVDPPETVYQEWRNSNFDFLNALECSGKLNSAKVPEPLVADLVGTVLEVILRMSELRASMKQTEKASCIQNAVFEHGMNAVNSTICVEESSEFVSQQILEVLVNLAVKVSEEKHAGHHHTDEDVIEWRHTMFEHLDMAEFNDPKVLDDDIVVQIDDLDTVD